MDFIVRYSLLLVGLFVVLILAFKVYERTDYVLLAAEPLVETIVEAEQIVASGESLDNFLVYRRQAKNGAAEQQSMEELMTVLTAGRSEEQKIVYAANNFLVYGTPSTQALDRWQRYQLLFDFVTLEQHLPAGLADWQRVLAR